jgi:hypothetical protein
LLNLLKDHYPAEGADSSWVAQVFDEIHDAFLRADIANYYYSRPDEHHIIQQVKRIEEASQELIEALTGSSIRRGVKPKVANVIWRYLGSAWTHNNPVEAQLQDDPAGQQSDDNAQPPHRWRLTMGDTAWVDEALKAAGRLNQRSRRILRWLEGSAQQTHQKKEGLGNSEHFLDSLVLTLGCSVALGGSQTTMTGRQEGFIAAYFQEAGRKHTTPSSIRGRWNRVKSRAGLQDDGGSPASGS